jgi:hypothetical protein
MAVEIWQTRQSSGVTFIIAVRLDTRLDRVDQAVFDRDPDVTRPSTGQQGLFEMQPNQIPLQMPPGAGHCPPSYNMYRQIRSMPSAWRTR